MQEYNRSNQYPELSNGNYFNKYYIAVYGNSLYDISHFLNISLDKLIAVNPQLSPYKVMLGEPVCIPVGEEAQYYTSRAVVYNIQFGDTIYSIQQKFNVLIEELVGINPNLVYKVLYPGQNIFIPVKWELFYSEDVNVSFRYPSHWIKIYKDHEQSIRYEGVDGFFCIKSIAISRDKFIDIKPVSKLGEEIIESGTGCFGANPQIHTDKIEGQPACYIISSPNQNSGGKSLSAIVVRYPKLIYKLGIPHAFCVIYTNKNYVRQISETIRFIKK